MTGVRAIEGAEDRFGFAADLVGIDHAAQTVAGVGFDGLEAGESAAFVKEVKSAAIHLQIELAADGEDGVSDGFGFNAQRRKTPEEAGVCVDALCFAG